MPIIPGTTIFNDPDPSISNPFGFPSTSAPPPIAVPTLGGAPTVSSTPTPGQGIALDSSGRLPTSVKTSAQEISYVEILTNATSTGTELTPTDFLVSPSIACDGAPLIFEFGWESLLLNGALGDQFGISLWMDSTDLGRLVFCTVSVAATNIFLPAATRTFRYAPPVGSHVFKVRGWRTGAGTESVVAGLGGAGANTPSFFRIVRA